MGVVCDLASSIVAGCFVSFSEFSSLCFWFRKTAIPAADEGDGGSFLINGHGQWPLA